MISWKVYNMWKQMKSTLTFWKEYKIAWSL